MPSEDRLSKKLRINFILPPMPKITGGPLAIVEYATRLRQRGHDVSITTYSDLFWQTETPFPWAKFDGPVHYVKSGMKGARKSGTMLKALSGLSKAMFGLNGKGLDALGTFAYLTMGAFTRPMVMRRVLGEDWDETNSVDLGMASLMRGLIAAASVTPAIPDCDINIATWWMTAFPAVWSAKGKPVYFMQHYEEVFYPTDFINLSMKLASRMSYELPLYKIANSSWLANLIEKKFGQKVPWTNNGLDLAVFKPAPKSSNSDGVFRVITYARAEEWKGFGDALEIMRRLRAKFPKLEWHVFGYLNESIPPDNEFAPYTYHKGLSFEALAALYARCDIALCPSWYESFPLPPIEAMAARTAVVTTSYGTEDFARDRETALVFGPRDVEGAVAKMTELLSDAALRDRLAEAGYQESKKFAWDHAVNEREKLLLAIHEGKTDYDIYSPANHGLRDGNGRLYNQLPVDMHLESPKLIRADADPDDYVYLFDGNSKRQLARPELVASYANLGPIQKVDSLTFTRIPNGFPVY